MFPGLDVKKVEIRNIAVNDTIREIENVTGNMSLTTGEMVQKVQEKFNKMLNNIPGFFKA